MSIFSGKCDFADHLFMQKNRTKDGSDKPEDLKAARVLYSDEQECFDIFKKKTGGVIYKLTPVTVTKNNDQLVAKYNQFFKIKTEQNDKGKIVVFYEYFGQRMTLNALNRKGVVIERPVRFNTLLDLIPYYPYVVVSITASDGLERCVIAESSFVDESDNHLFTVGIDFSDCINYRAFLQEHYIEVVHRYFNPEGRECRETVTFDSETYIAKVANPIDYNFELEWVWGDNPKLHWAAPQIVDAAAGLIKIHPHDYNAHGNTLTVYYVKAKEKPELYLN